MYLSRKIIKLGVFCGAQKGNSTTYREAAEQFADEMSKMGVSLVYGGSKVGLMGAIANRMLNNGSSVIGVIPQSLVDIEIAHEGLTELHVVPTMHERKILIAKLSDGFVMLPGGVGSLDEFFEMLTLNYLGYQSKPCGILNVSSYYDHLLKFLDHATSQEFFKESLRNSIIVEQFPDLLIDRLVNYQDKLEHSFAAKESELCII